MGPVKVILNPIAGRGYAAKVEPEVRRLLAAEGLEFDLVRTAGPWHAVELAEQAVAKGFETVVAAGGDGTTHEVVNGLMAAAGNGVAGTLGIIPIGSGSDFAHTVGVPSDLPGACRRLARGRVRVVDVGRVVLDGDAARYFDNTVGVGFDGVVTERARRVKRLRGMALYLPVVLKTIFIYYKAPHVTIEFDDRRMDFPALMICVANGPREGGSFLVTPDARPDDGLFDLCIAGEVGRLEMLRLVPQFLKGSHVDHRAVTMTRARRVVISSEKDLVAHADGEVLCTAGHRLEFEILPQRLRVRC